MSKLSELAVQLNALGDKLTGVTAELVKAKDEIVTAIQSTDVELPPDGQAALDRLTTISSGLEAIAKQLDDLNPDATAPEPPAAAASESGSEGSSPT